MRPTLTILAAASLILSACSQQDTKIETALDPALDPTVAAEVTAEATTGPVPEDQPCNTAIGQQAADKLVQRCIAVSPATHPPCNAENTCETIQGEITRSCDMYGADEKPPAECAPTPSAS